MADVPLPMPGDHCRGEASLERLRIEVMEVDARARIGGLFYVIGWVVTVSAAPLLQRQPLLVSLFGVLLLALAIARFRVAPAADADAAALRRARRRQWSIVLSTAAVWGLLALLCLSTPAYQQAIPLLLICSVFFGTAFAHTFGMHLGLSAIGLALVYLPAPLLVGDTLGRSIQIALAVYALYLCGALLRAHRDYQRRLSLEDALREQRDLFRRLSQIDGLTGLLNRGELSGRLRSAFEQSRRSGARLGFLLLDIDHFKRINDSLGHAAGDAALVGLAERLRSLFDGVVGAAVGRWGGEEFAVLLPGGSETAARIAAESLLDDLRRRPLIDGVDPITASIGVGELRDRHGSADALINDVDRAMYRAKHAGRACVRGLADELLLGGGEALPLASPVVGEPGKDL